MKDVLILCESDPNREPRVIRTVEALAGSYNIIVCAYKQYKGVSFFDLTPFINKKKKITFHLHYPLLLRKAISLFLNMVYYRTTKNNILNPGFKVSAAAHALSDRKPSIVICHGLGLMELGVLLKNKGAKLIFNAHEYYPAEFEDKPEWREMGNKYIALLKRCAPSIDLIFAVNKTIGERYLKEFNIPFVEVLNAPDYEADLIPSPVNQVVKIVHHSVALKNRKIESIIEGILKTSLACELYLILVPVEKEYYQELKTKYGNEKKIIFLEPVEVKKISQYLNKFDIGLFYREPGNYNELHALPNKLFEFIQARLAIIVSPNPEMKNIVEGNKLGWVTAEFTLDSLVNTLNGIDRITIAQCKSNSHECSKTLSSIKSKQMMLESVNQLCAA